MIEIYVCDRLSKRIDTKSNTNTNEIDFFADFRMSYLFPFMTYIKVLKFPPDLHFYFGIIVQHLGR